MLRSIRKKLYFFDMDGVLAIYERHAYDPEKGPVKGIALYEHEESHYFKHCLPDPTAIGMLNDLLQKKDAEVFVLTTVAPHTPWAAEDKREWLSQFVPNFDSSSHLIIADCDKAETIIVKQQLKSLNGNMILIDDFNRNLEDWRSAGGMSIKYLNGINSQNSFDGPYIKANECRLGGTLI